MAKRMKGKLWQLILLLFFVNLILFVLTRVWDGGCSGCNVVLITIDNWPYTLRDKFNTESGSGWVSFDGAYSNSTWALPSYSALYGGDYPAVFGAWRTDDKINGAEKNFVSRLKESGYRTTALSVGPFFQTKWGFGEGFDEFSEMKNTDQLDNRALELVKSIQSKNSGSEFIWLRYGGGFLESSQGGDFENVISSVSKVANIFVSVKNTRVIVLGAAGELMTKPYDKAIHVPMFIGGADFGRVGLLQGIFELKDLGKLILNEREYREIRKDKKNIVALSSSAEDRQKILDYYKNYQAENELVLEVRKDEWDEPYFASSRSQNWQIIRNSDSSYELYNLTDDMDEKNNLFEDWNVLPDLSRSEAVEVIRSVGGDVPAVCGVYCGSNEFFK